MSNIYIQEPPTKGKVILNTTVGEIEIELWSKECPKAARNFIQLCLEGYYDGTIFHRIIKDFIAQGGDPTGTGQGGESIYGEPFKDEFHSRLRYNRRGLVGMASSEPNDNGSQFFFTLGATAELEKKNTLFGKVVGKTVYNMIKLNDCECVGESPLRPEKIISTEVVYNPFEDIKPRQLKAEPVKKETNESKDKKKVVKNFGLLSFGDEAEEEEEELESVSKTLKSKPKSAHDIGDPSLLSKKVVEEDKSGRRSDSSDKSGSESEEERPAAEKKSEAVKIDEIKSKLERKAAEMASKSSSSQKADKKPISEEDQKRKETQEEIRRIQRELAEGRKQKRDEDDKIEEKKKEKKQEEEVVKEYKQDVEKYEHLRNKKLKKDKEEKTLELLNAFRNKLFKAKETELSHDNQEAAKTSSTEETETKKDNSEAASGAVASASFESLLTHKLDIDDEIRMKVIDANVADNERYDIYDPRNPLNKRKRDESRDMSREKKNKPSLGGMRRDAL